MSDIKQSCESCTHYHPVDKERLVPGQRLMKIGECMNKECAWHGMKRAPSEGIFCPDYSNIGPFVCGTE